MSRRQKSDSKKAASRGLQWTSDMIRKIVDDKTYIGCMVYGKTKIPDPGTGKEVPVPRNQWKVMENHHEPIASKEVFEKHSPCRSGTPRKANLTGKQHY
ncbi:MAG: recombinase family protein [Gallintestinimicrobium sp.]|uniref:recombinase family protein n=1 Tax=Gallintestinimicrobium sp. TaxID=2981655 RepID=UPI003999F2F6